MWLLKTPNAPKKLEFWDRPPYCRQHAQARAFYRLGSCPPISQSGRSATGEPRPPSPAARSSSTAAESASTVYDRPLALGLALRLWPRCLDTMKLVKPATVIQWHRQ